MDCDEQAIILNDSHPWLGASDGRGGVVAILVDINSGLFAILAVV